MMDKVFGKIRGVGLPSAVYVGLGLVLILFPGFTTTTLCRIIGVALMIYGINRLVDSRRNRGGYAEYIVPGVATVLGFVLLTNAAGILSILPMLLGIYLVIQGIGEVRKAINMRGTGVARWKVSGLLAVLMIVGGALVLVDPFSTFELCVMVFGGSLVVAGITGMLSDEGIRKKSP